MSTVHNIRKREQQLRGLIARDALHENSVSRSLTRSRVDHYLQAFVPKVAMLSNLLPHVRDVLSLYARAERLDLRQPTNDPVSVIELPRLGRAPRRVCKLPMQLRVSHRLAKAVVESRFTPRNHIYNWQGRGSHRLIGDLVDAMPGGSGWLLLADIADCYDSVVADAIGQLDILPEPFVRANMDARNMRFELKVCQHQAGRSMTNAPNPCTLCHDQPVPTAFGGLLQGSPASSALLAMLLDDLPSHMPDGVKLFVYADNIAVVSPTEEASREAETALGRYLSGHPAGPLSLVIDQRSYAVSYPVFELLGYLIRWTGDRWYVSHSPRNMMKAYYRVVACTQRGDVAGVDETITEMVRGFPALSCEALEDLLDLIDVYQMDAE